MKKYQRGRVPASSVSCEYTLWMYIATQRAPHETNFLRYDVIGQTVHNGTAGMA
jgi:hypothetical protein